MDYIKIKTDAINANSIFVEVNKLTIPESLEVKYWKLIYRKDSIKNFKLSYDSNFVEIVMYDNSSLLLCYIDDIQSSFFPISHVNDVEVTSTPDLFEKLRAIL